MIHSSTLAGSRVVHQLSHRSTLLHLLGPELYTSFLIDPLFYTCWVQNYTLGANFRNGSTLLHQLGPELYTSWVQTYTLAGSRIIHQVYILSKSWVQKSTLGGSRNLHLLGPGFYTRYQMQPYDWWLDHTSTLAGSILLHQVPNITI